MSITIKLLISSIWLFDYLFIITLYVHISLWSLATIRQTHQDLHLQQILFRFHVPCLNMFEPNLLTLSIKNP